MTCLDGYQMAKKGRAGAALALVAIGSWIAGSLGILGLQFFAPLLGSAALSFGPPEYLAFMFLAFVLLSNLSSDAPLKGALMIAFGLFISSIGINPLDSFPRFTFGWDQLMMGIDFLPIAMGFFGISEILNIALETYVVPEVKKIRFKELYPTREEGRRSFRPMLRGSVSAFLWACCQGPARSFRPSSPIRIEKKISKNPEEFGQGAVEGCGGAGSRPTTAPSWGP